jgi:methyl-accepting chemotaxis protein
LRGKLDDLASAALAEAQIFGHEPSVIDALDGRDRNGLLRGLEGIFAYLKAHDGVSILQFQTPDLITLARLHDPGRFGDDVGPIRPIVVSANRSLAEQSGAEIGPTKILAVRGVAPVIKDGRFLGTAEVGFEIDPSLRTLKAQTGADLAILLAPSMIGGATNGGGPDLMLAFSTDKKLFENAQQRSALKISRGGAQAQADIDGDLYGFATEPLLDFSGHMIGVIAAAKNLSAAHSLVLRQALLLAFAAFCGLVFAHALIVVSVRTFVVRPVQALTRYAQTIYDGQTAEVPLRGGVAVFDKLFDVVLALAEARERGQGDARREP